MLTAILTDEDNTAPGQGVWQWAKSDSMNVPFTNIPERSGDRTYRPVEADLNQYLQVTVEYKDRSGSKTRKVQQVSAYPVRRDTSTSNDPPKFPDQSTLMGATTIRREATERFILENSPERTRVGAPVTAFDDATDIEVLAYSLSDTTAGSGHARSFNIDPVTGQITVSASAKLDAEVGTGQPGDARTPYLVTVRATDGDGDTTDIAVTIRVVGINEPPKIGADPNANPPVVAAREMSHYERSRDDPCYSDRHHLRHGRPRMLLPTRQRTRRIWTPRLLRWFAGWGRRRPVRR